MKALILVGGFGTRLRPLTFSAPKPLVEFANKATVEHQIEALAKVGVKNIILAVGFRPDQMIESMKEFEKKYNVKITCSFEKEPLGTAGPLQLAKENLVQDNSEGLIFVFNSDVICDFPLEQLKKIHLEKKAEATLILTKVQDPSRFGVVVTNPDNQILSFVEKPQTFISDRINAGLYILNTSVIDRIPLKFTMLEKDVFPQMAQEGKLFAFDLQGFWMDIGQPKDFIKGNELYLDFLQQKKNDQLVKGPNIIGNVMINPDSQISPNSIIGPNVTIDSGCVIEEGVRLKNTVVLKGCKIKSNSWIDNSIIGWKSTVGKWVRIEGVTVLGEDVQVKDEIYLNGIFVLPHKGVNENISEKGKIIM